MQGGADDVGLERDAVPVAAHELHDRLHPQLLECDRDRERGRMRVCGGVVGRVDGVDEVLVGLEALVHRVETAAVDGQQLGGDDELAPPDPLLEPRHPTPPASACRGR